MNISDVTNCRDNNDQLVYLGKYLDLLKTSMENIDDVSEEFLSFEQKGYLLDLNATNEATVFPDSTQRKLLSIINDLAKHLKDK